MTAPSSDRSGSERHALSVPARPFFERRSTRGFLDWIKKVLQAANPSFPGLRGLAL
jgi:hypothetical protein